MIHLKITSEIITDLMTPGACMPQTLVEGLPAGCELINISFDLKNRIALYVFDDGEAETTDVVLKYRAITPSIETV